MNYQRKSILSKVENGKKKSYSECLNLQQNSPSATLYATNPVDKIQSYGLRFSFYVLLHIYTRRQLF